MATTLACSGALGSRISGDLRQPGGRRPAGAVRAVRPARTARLRAFGGGGHVRRIALETNVVALDVTEVCPPYDHADLTVNNAHRLIWETLAGLACKRARRTE
ncbi:arginase family protein [Streptomyces sp. NPDC059679]|uniref:arginase family protein n=1 Tax=Streptomyces sp. NPDC059679 TaxID=3346903 RepID=UPI00369E3063